MTRPIEQERSRWCTAKEAASLSGRDPRTVQRWVGAGLVRTWREPGGRLWLYKPDFCRPDALPDKKEA